MNTNPIAVFLDGTKNIGREGSESNTNVYTLFRETEAKHQSIRYVEGIASDPVPVISMFGSWKMWAKQETDALLGSGATDMLQKAYLFICENYDPRRPLFLFGFSRGAFVASILAGFLYRVGVLFAEPFDESALAKAFYLYYMDADGKDFAELVRQVEQSSGRNVESIRTHFLGQWDAVETLEVAGFSAPTEQLLLAIAKRERSKPLPNWIDKACHALAIHEVRQLFEPNVWSGVSNADTQSLEQAWFPGAHADVGGGYNLKESKNRQHYAQISLMWMRDRACEAGLKTNPIVVEGSSIADDKPTTPATATFCGLPPRIRPILEHMPPNNVQGFYLHDSVIERLWEPIEKAYSKASILMRNAWKAADSASMRFHYAEFLGSDEMPKLNSQQLKQDIADLWKFLSGKEALSHDELVTRLGMALIFYLSPDRYIVGGKTPPQPIVDQLLPALAAVEKKLSEYVHKNSARRLHEYHVYLLWMTLTLSLAHMDHPGYKVAKRKVIKI